MSKSVLDVRKETIGFSLTDGEAELVLMPQSHVTVLYDLKGGQQAVAEGPPEFVVKLLAKAGIRAIVQKGLLLDE